MLHNVEMFLLLDNNDFSYIQPMIFAGVRMCTFE